MNVISSVPTGLEMAWSCTQHAQLPIGTMAHVSRNLESIKPRTLALKTNANKNTHPLRHNHWGPRARQINLDSVGGFARERREADRGQREKPQKYLSASVGVADNTPRDRVFWVERWQQKFNAWNAKHTNILTFKAQILIHMHTILCALRRCPSWASASGCVCLLCSFGAANFPWKLHELQIFVGPSVPPALFRFFHTHEMRSGRSNGTFPTLSHHIVVRSQVACAVDIFMACSELPDGSCRLALAAKYGKCFTI